ncbi:MAG: tetraacyldisaccharide 4'-kinase [Janthinobacterium lividum]
MSARRRWAWPLVPLYAGALATKGALQAVGILRERKLGWPVISIGSVSAGGAGKTPLVIALAKLLSERGWTVDVLSRGYQRSGRGVEPVDLSVEEPARQFGDEPTLIAQRTGVPVWVGPSRYAAGRAAEYVHQQEPQKEPVPQRDTEPQEAMMLVHGAGIFSLLPEPDFREETVGLQAHLLDDGMQHRSLARNFDLVLVTAEDLRDTLLPLGNLREPLTRLREADALAVREDELADLRPRLRTLVGTEIPLWTIRRFLRFPAPLGVFGAGLRPLAFCALARPEGFASMLAKAGCGVVDTVVFGDHHRYEETDITELISMAKRLKATGLVTTEKDAVKLTAAMQARLEAEVGPLMVVALDAAFVYEAPVMRLLEARLRPAMHEHAGAGAVRSH